MSSLVVEDRTDVKDAEMVDFEADPFTRMDKILQKMKVGQSTLYLLLYQARIFVAVFRYSSPAAHFQACVITTANLFGLISSFQENLSREVSERMLLVEFFRTQVGLLSAAL